MNSADSSEAIVYEHYEALFRFALSLARAESDARDLTQKTFCIWARRKGRRLWDPLKVKTWLFTTLHRAFLQTRRRQARFRHQELAEVSGANGTSLPGNEAKSVAPSERFLSQMRGCRIEAGVPKLCSGERDLSATRLRKPFPTA